MHLPYMAESGRFAVYDERNQQMPEREGDGVHLDLP